MVNAEHGDDELLRSISLAEEDVLLGRSGTCSGAQGKQTGGAPSNEFSASSTSRGNKVSPLFSTTTSSISCALTVGAGGGGVAGGLTSGVANGAKDRPSTNNINGALGSPCPSTAIFGSVEPTTSEEHLQHMNYTSSSSSSSSTCSAKVKILGGNKNTSSSTKVVTYEDDSVEVVGGDGAPPVGSGGHQVNESSTSSSREKKKLRKDTPAARTVARFPSEIVDRDEFNKLHSEDKTGRGNKKIIRKDTPAPPGNPTAGAASSSSQSQSQMILSNKIDDESLEAAIDEIMRTASPGENLRPNIGIAVDPCSRTHSSEEASCTSSTSAGGSPDHDEDEARIRAMASRVVRDIVARILQKWGQTTSTTPSSTAAMEADVSGGDGIGVGLLVNNNQNIFTTRTSSCSPGQGTTTSTGPAPPEKRAASGHKKKHKKRGQGQGDQNGATTREVLGGHQSSAPVSPATTSTQEGTIFDYNVDTPAGGHHQDHKRNPTHSSTTTAPSSSKKQHHKGAGVRRASTTGAVPSSTAANSPTTMLTTAPGNSSLASPTDAPAAPPRRGPSRMKTVQILEDPTECISAEEHEDDDEESSEKHQQLRTSTLGTTTVQQASTSILSSTMKMGAALKRSLSRRHITTEPLVSAAKAIVPGSGEEPAQPPKLRRAGTSYLQETVPHSHLPGMTPDSDHHQTSNSANGALTGTPGATITNITNSLTSIATTTTSSPKPPEGNSIGADEAGHGQGRPSTSSAAGGGGPSGGGLSGGGPSGGGPSATSGSRHQLQRSATHRLGDRPVSQLSRRRSLREPSVKKDYRLVDFAMLEPR
ncbi:unnamed protein product [Amoebophrya sp. A25]|nr:unnamed protein product [Amoebophrya sp. A25]|eukprot:GSA25T00001486001.1